MNGEKGVEWDLVDYGAGVFHVASYQERSEAAVEPEAEQRSERFEIPECFFHRCWSALRDGCRAA